ncbi:hypothetical protein DFH09DRAFT_1325462 [Mycena vulgaris]|nr:hypothetical protein DFH09DRAFT_1325462 [Mycena vulgaris]
MISISTIGLIFLSPAVVLSSLAAGCTSSTSWTFDSKDHSNRTIGNRSFLVHVPAKYDPRTAHPVVLSFHGYGESDKTQEKITGLSTAGYLIDGKGIIAVYPLAAYGPGKHHKPARAWAGAPYSPQDVDDLGFVAALMDSLQNNLCVDSKRIYASGMSNGGGFVGTSVIIWKALRCLRRLPIVSAALYNDTHPFDDCTPGRKIPLITFHGTADETVPYDVLFVSPSVYLIDDTVSIPQWRDAWVVRNGCDASTPSDLSDPYDDVVETTWQCGDNNETIIKAFDIEDGIHKWPSTEVTSFDGTPEEILPFFNQYTLQ